MRIADQMLAELEQEAVATRRVLERVPQQHLTWRPHAKSMSLGQLALHVATIPGNVAQLLSPDVLSEPPAFVQPEAARASELLPGARAEPGAGPRVGGRHGRQSDGGAVAIVERRARTDGNATGGGPSHA